MGLNYSPNPKTPYEEASRHKDVIDFLQFPQETFQYKAGDCSDISILYGSLFQAVGIDAAFITIPGHIYIAVEITSIHDGFMTAWQIGAKEWTENNSTGQAGFYPIQEAWAVYQPVRLPGAQTTIAAPQSDSIITTVAGNGSRGYSGDGGAAASAQLKETPPRLR